ncbi:hypothetical protein psal_cds_857 [Pandoravirus salinus]|uniref:Uncharacterized protein n=1 Tax=Pandoravirus salinus TaxID=1349410 RepID=S4VX16_9VIRU|nr:hypothetical protein psal_cds_857 [Pandoravirus salinus]AGO84918.2 hypothetical protein psal_cds_857 [Pandoravirus salinus]
MATIDDLPNELAVHIVRVASDDIVNAYQKDAFLAAVRLTARRWRDAASPFWRPVTPHAYGRCLQFLKDTGNAPLMGATKRQIAAWAMDEAARAPVEAGPALDGIMLRPYDYATALVEAFGADAPAAAKRERLGERCPACAQRPDRCTCLCSACWPCKGDQPLAQCRMVRSDRWDADYPGDWDGDVDNGGRLASYYPRRDAAFARHRKASESCWTRLRQPTLAHWEATCTNPTDAAIYVARCAQTLVSHALADADVIARMSCSAVVRRAHRLGDYCACAADRLWDIDNCDCGCWVFGEKRCVCDNVKMFYDADDVETDGEYHLDVAHRHGRIQCA